MENNNNVPVKFTQEIKDNWLANLKSGKYVQGFHSLAEYDPKLGKNVHCCIGVLGDCTEGLDNTTSECYASDGEPINPYAFLNSTIGKDMTYNIFYVNDDIKHVNTGKRDYSNVIPLIEALPVTE